MHSQGVPRTLRDEGIAREVDEIKGKYVRDASMRLGQEEHAFIQGGGLGLANKAVSMRSYMSILRGNRWVPHLPIPHLLNVHQSLSPYKI